MMLLLAIWLLYIGLALGQLPKAPYPYPEQRTDRLKGTYNITVNNFHLAPVGTTSLFEGGDECNRIWITITVGPKFWSLDVQNPFACDCFPFDSCWPPKGAWKYRSLNPFMVTFTDVTTSAWFVLPTRHNSPDAAGSAPTLLQVPQGVDRLQTTASVLITLDFKTRDRISYYTQEMGPSIECNAEYDGSPAKPGTHQRYADKGTVSIANVITSVPFIWRTLGMQVHRFGKNGPTNKLWVKRKRPYPPFQLFLWNRCCSGSYYYYSCPLVVWTTQQTAGMSATEFVTPTLTNPCCYNSYSGGCGCQNHFFEIHFYENTRYYSASYSHNNISTVGENAVTALTTVGASTIYTPPDAVHPIQFKFINMGLFYNSTFIYDQPNPARRYRRAMFILQPFPISDLWIQVTSEVDGGTAILFQEQEVHVPYIPKDDEGHVGWLWPIEHMYNRTSWSCRLTVKYNLRPKMGDTTEQIKARLLFRWLSDQGAALSKIVAPIPATILIKPQLMGAVATQAFSAGQQVGTIPWDAVLHSNYSRQFYNMTLAPVMATIPACAALLSEVDQFSTLDPQLEKMDFQNALFATLRGMNPNDNTSSWFVFYDSWHPKRPTQLPVFFDPTLLTTLLGFSEIPTFAAQSLQKWQEEYDTLATCFPWWTSEITAFRWANTRAWTKAVSYYNGGIDLMLIPGPSVFRQGKNPNVQVQWNGWIPWYDMWNDIILKAKLNISVNDELVLDYQGWKFDAITYFMRYGDVPVDATDSCSLPELPFVLLNTNQSRANAVWYLAALHNETYVDSLSRLLLQMSSKQAKLPLTINGLGAEPYIVAAANRILAAEKATLSTQLAYGWYEYWDLLSQMATPAPP
jgi:hypothetical protein